MQTYIDNLRDCQTFQAASAEKFAIADEDALHAIIGSSWGVSTVFLTGLCKWLLGLAIAQNSDIEVKSVIGYRVLPEAEHEDIVSIALKFSPSFTPMLDPLGLAAQIPTPHNEGALATKALKRLAKCVDADAVLAENAEIRQAMELATVKLLGLARYDINAFYAWIGCPIPS